MSFRLKKIDTRLQLVLAALLVLSNLQAQTDLFLEAKSIAEARAIETALNSTMLEPAEANSIKISFPGASMDKEYKGLTFMRHNDDFSPNLKVVYLYEADDKDSTLVCAFYQWDIMNHIKNIYDDADKLEAQLIRKADYLNKYENVKSLVTKLLSKRAKSQEKTSTPDHSYASTWSTKQVNIRLDMHFSTKLKSVRDMQIGTFRVRLYMVYD